MKLTKKKQTALFWISLALCVANTATVLAQPIEIVVTGGGFTVHGPSSLDFAPQPFSFDDQQSAIDFKDVAQTGSPPAPPYLEVSDQNGGSAFSVAIGATDLTPGGNGICNTNNCIPKANLSILNNDGSSNSIDTIEGSSNYVSLDASTSSPAALDQQRVLLNGTGASPGTWRIYPELQELTPGNTAIGNYSGTLTITIMTT